MDKAKFVLSIQVVCFILVDYTVREYYSKHYLSFRFSSSLPPCYVINSKSAVSSYTSTVRIYTSSYTRWAAPVQDLVSRSQTLLSFAERVWLRETIQDRRRPSVNFVISVNSVNPVNAVNLVNFVKVKVYKVSTATPPLSTIYTKPMQ